jgi:hypothetical protein
MSASASENPQCGHDDAARWIRWTHRGHFIASVSGVFTECLVVRQSETSIKPKKPGLSIASRHAMLPP